MKKFLVGCWFFSCIAVLPLVLGEVYFSIVDSSDSADKGRRLFAPQALRQRSLQYQPTIYARHIFPAMAQQVEAWGGGEIKVNSKGYRGAEFSVEKPADTIRVMIYGGSSVFDLAAPGDLDWPRLVEAQLRDAGFGNVEVINAGIPGHASTDVVTRLLTEGHYLKPDYMLIYNGWNDIKYFSKSQPILRHMEPIGLNPLLYYQGEFDRFLSENSAIYIRLRQLYWKTQMNIQTEGAIARDREIAKTLQLGKLLPETASGQHGVHRRGPAQYEMNIRAFIDVVRNIGATPILVSQASLVHPANTDSEKKSIRYDYINLSHEGLVDAYQEIARALANVAVDKGGQLIDAAAMVPKKSEYFHDHVHLKWLGSRHVAKVVAAELKNLLNRKAARAEY
jgi:lysophospholipase L1-like esterase